MTRAPRPPSVRVGKPVDVTPQLTLAVVRILDRYYVSWAASLTVEGQEQLKRWRRYQRRRAVYVRSPYGYPYDSAREARGRIRGFVAEEAARAAR